MNQATQITLSPKLAFYLGLCGALGSLILFVGDMLFFYHGDSTDIFKNMGIVSPDRIIFSGLSALFAAWFYTLGAGQIYYAFQPAKKWLKLTVFFSFASLMITYGIVHAAFVAIATSAQIATELGKPAETFIKLAFDANMALRTVAYVPFALFALLFTYAVWQKHTLYPRWMLFFNPLVPFLFNDLIVNSLSGSTQLVISSGYLNLILLLFFTASTIALKPKTQLND